MKLTFNTGKVVLGDSITPPSANEIENTPTLRQASLDIALRHGGTLTRRALDALPIKYDHKYVVVDTKVHLLMPGWSPSIPGWHTDGVPRGPEHDPAGKGEPDIAFQVFGGLRPPRYHLLVCGAHSLTRFLSTRHVYLDVPSEPSRDLYALLTRQITARSGPDGDLSLFQIPDATAATWDWWELHSAQWATGSGWRFLIRVTETDHIAPRTQLAAVLRAQNMVFVNGDEVGW